MDNLELLDALNESLKNSNDEELKKLESANNAKKQEALSFDDFFLNASENVNEAKQTQQNNTQSIKEQDKPQEEQSLVDEAVQEQKANNKAYSLYDYYLLNKAGLGSLMGATNNEDLKLKIKSLSGEKEYQQIKDINHAFNNLNSIIKNSNQTSGTWNNLARGVSNLTGHFISADKENQERINDNAGLFGNYLNAVSLRSGGTANERARIREAINFGNLNAKDTRDKALKIYDDLMQRQQIALNTLKAKGYNENMIFHDENELNAFYRNQKIYDYLKSGKSFNEKDFNTLSKYGVILNEENKSLRKLKE